MCAPSPDCKFFFSTLGSICHCYRLVSYHAAITSALTTWHCQSEVWRTGAAIAEALISDSDLGCVSLLLGVCLSSL